MDPWAYLDEFRAEAGEHLRALDALLLRLEGDPTDRQAIREMMLSAHAVKGGAAMIGLADVRRLAHAVEDVLVHLRETEESLDAPTADLLFRSLDLLRDLAAQATPADAAADARVDPLEAALRQRARGLPPSDGDQAATGWGSAPRDPTAAPADSQPADAGTPRALLVDDSATVRLLESMVLQEAGYEVDAVADGSEALARALSRPYQLVVTSVETRGLRGVDLAAAVRALPTGRGVPIIVMSSDDDAHERQRAAAVGVQAYIRKGSFGERRLLEAARELRPTGDG